MSRPLNAVQRRLPVTRGENPTAESRRIQVGETSFAPCADGIIPTCRDPSSLRRGIFKLGWLISFPTSQPVPSVKTTFLLYEGRSVAFGAVAISCPTVGRSSHFSLRLLRLAVRYLSWGKRRRLLSVKENITSAQVCQVLVND